ncbi:hypothetical protein [Streptomyces sp. NPDC005876]|uniref:hypothetical protein n=1 Tax=unclassified Streptomyces TaxID=2593676 RepID=UPI003402D059
MSDNKAALAAAMAGGYLLGRSRKARLALAVGTYLAGRRFGLTPGQMLGQGLGRLQGVPQLQELTDQVRGELLTAGRQAVGAAADRRLTRLADALRDRTDALGGTPDRQEGDAEDDGRYDDGPEAGGSDGPPEPVPPRKAAERAAARKRPAGKAVKKAAVSARRQARAGGRA